MTEIARRTNGAPVAKPAEDSAAKLIRWAEAAQAAHTLATSLVRTAFVPKEYRGKPDEATAAILAGAELGFDPMASLRTFDNIQGTTAPKAITLRAVAQSHGHEIEIVEESDTRAVARFRRKGATEWQTTEWTIERAKKLGLPGRNPNWNTQPQNMLVARVTAEASRRVASDAILGIPYSSEELRDSPELTGPPPPARVTASEVLRQRPPRAQQRLPQAPPPDPVPEGQQALDDTWVEEPPEGWTGDDPDAGQ
jgi:hypothetical protein